MILGADGKPVEVERDTYVDAPYVCPGCYAIGGEPCAPGCLDNQIEQERLDAIDGWGDDETSRARR